jgi:carnitine-CoA ligase
MSTVYDRVGMRTLNDAFAERVVDHPEREFLVFETADGATTSWTYARFDARCEEFARGLAGLGVVKADPVVLRMSMGVDLIAAWFACLRLGAIAVPAPLAQTHDETMWMTGLIEPRLVIADPDWADMYIESVTASDVLAAQSTYVAPAVAPDDVAEVIFTSGSTARPKGVMITHANLLHSGERQSSMRALDAGERCLTALPWFHVNCQSVTVLAALAVGGTAILLERYSARRFMDQVRRHRATQVTLGAMLVRTLLSQPPSDEDAQHVVRRAFYGLAISDREKHEFERRFGMTLLNGYGLSEAVAEVFAVPVFGPKRWPSLGLPVQDRLVRLVDDGGQDVASGQTGEIIVHGRPGWTLMSGYWRDEAATALAIRDGWLHTGDLAHVDEAGYFYFDGRKKDVIKRAGENISALEVEEALMTHPQVAEAVVVGAPDPMREEAVWAYVTLTDGRTDGETLIAYCMERLSQYKVPTVVHVLEEFPRTGAGKVDKVSLRASARNAAISVTGGKD